MKFTQSIFIVVLLLSVFVSMATAHTFHTSLTRIDYNEKEKLAEISIQLFTHDLLSVLEQRARKNVDLEKTPDVDKFIFDYLNENFVLKDKKNEMKKPVWVGKEIQADTVFVYLEIPLEETLEGMSLQNTIFFESFPEQTNLVTARFNGNKADLLFKVGDTSKIIAKSESKEHANKTTVIKSL